MESRRRPNRPADAVKRSPPARRTLQRLKTESNLDVLARNELELKANVFYHIGNPLKRWRVEKVVPGKLVLQLLKTFCLIVQVSISFFKGYHYIYVQYGQFAALYYVS